MSPINTDWLWPDLEPEAPASEVPECLRCGGACCRVDWVIAFDQDEPVPRWLSVAGTRLVNGYPGRERMMRKNGDGACVALSNGLCGIYDLRPTPCREFEAGSDCCLEAMVAKPLDADG